MKKSLGAISRHCLVCLTLVMISGESTASDDLILLDSLMTRGLIAQSDYSEEKARIVKHEVDKQPIAVSAQIRAADTEGRIVFAVAPDSTVVIPDVAVAEKSNSNPSGKLVCRDCDRNKNSKLDKISIYYIEANYGFTEYDEEDHSVRPQIGMLKIGANLEENFSVEMMFGMNARKFKGYINGYSASLKYDRVVGLYLKTKLEVMPKLEVFVRYGYSRFEATATRESYSSYATASHEVFQGLSYGVGAEFKFSPSVYAQIDYMSYYDKRGVTLAGPSLGLGLKF